MNIHSKFSKKKLAIENLFVTLPDKNETLVKRAGEGSGRSRSLKTNQTSYVT